MNVAVIILPHLERVCEIAYLECDFRPDDACHRSRAVLRAAVPDLPRLRDQIKRLVVSCNPVGFTMPNVQNLTDGRRAECVAPLWWCWVWVPMRAHWVDSNLVKLDSIITCCPQRCKPSINVTDGGVGEQESTIVAARCNALHRCKRQRVPAAACIPFGWVRHRAVHDGPPLKGRCAVRQAPHPVGADAEEDAVAEDPTGARTERSPTFTTEGWQEALNQCASAILGEIKASSQAFGHLRFFLSRNVSSQQASLRDPCRNLAAATVAKVNVIWNLYFWKVLKPWEEII